MQPGCEAVTPVAWVSAEQRAAPAAGWVAVAESPVVLVASDSGEPVVTVS
jgi:hypothetical protein